MPPTLLEWVKKSEVDSGQCEGVTTNEREQLKALFDRQPKRHESLVHHSDRGSQYVSIRSSERLAEAEENYYRQLAHSKETIVST